MLEDRTLLSSAGVNLLPDAPAASSPPGQPSAAVAQYVATVIHPWNHLVVMVQQEVVGAYKMLGQEFAQAVSNAQQQWSHLLGIVSHVSNQAPNILVSHPGGNSPTTRNGQNQPHNPAAQKPGSSSGNGQSMPSAATSPPPRMMPMTGEPSVYLSSSSYTVNENAGSIALQVNLSGSVYGPVSVELSTSNGTATSGTDYDSVDTNVVFQGGTTSQTVNVTILDDGDGDDSVGSEYFNVQLSNPTNAALEAPSSATVTIQEPSSPPPLPPPPPPPPPPPIPVSGKVWLDSDDDGKSDPGESFMSGIFVILDFEDAAGDVLSYMSTTTGPDGSYNFDVPARMSGSLVQIYVVIPSGYQATLEDVTELYGDSNIDAGGYSPVCPLYGSLTIWAGLDYLAAPVACYDSYSVIHDNTLTVSTASGVLANDNDPNSLPLTASLVSGPSNGTLILNSDGSFIYQPNAGYIGSDSFVYVSSDGSYASDATVTLSINSSISGQVWLDGNEDGIENDGEMGMSGITVNLIALDGSTTSSTTTDANGDYQLAADPSLSYEYQILVVIPDGYSATIPSASASGVYSSIDFSGYSPFWDSSHDSNINAGLVMGSGPLASISGEVWFDGNGNGVLEDGESGLQAIKVNLLDSNNENRILGSTSTDENGDYSFFSLTPNTSYTVQFVAPSGDVFSPQNVGPSATSSSAGPNGKTNSMVLSLGQNDNTVNAGLYGSAPIVYQTNVAMAAENDNYTDMDMTADGYDPNGEPLTPIIVQAPSVGSLIYDTSTGLYDYRAPTNYTGEDHFEFELSNGHAVSAVVYVQVLAYTGLLEPHTQDSPVLAAGLFDGNNGKPDPSSVKQGKMNDCWFVASAAGLAQQDPDTIVRIIPYSKTNINYTVIFPGQKPVEVRGSLMDGHSKSYSTANGDWLHVLEMAYGQMVYNQTADRLGRTFAGEPFDYISAPNLPSAGVEALTGNATDVDYFWCTRDSTTRQKLTNAFANGNHKVVTAQIFGGSDNEQMAKKEGLVAYHVYTVVAYDPISDRVRLRNPHKRNPLYPDPTGGPHGPLIYRGKGDADNPGTNTTGYFWMSLSSFTRMFSGICYEE